MRPRRLSWMAACVVLSACAGPPEDEASQGPPLLPGGYQVVLDRDHVAPGHFVTAETPDGIRLTTGPAGIAWRPADTVSAGDFRAEVTLTLHGAPIAYREAYGLFVGGRNLEGPGPSYLALLVRATGEFMVGRRVGEASETVVDWLPHNTVQRVADDGDEPVNALAVEVRWDETRFLINGVVVFIMPTNEARPHGGVGIRVNQRLDLTRSVWSLGPPPPEAPVTSGS